MPEQFDYTPPTPVRILIVDGDRRVRQSMAGLIELADGIESAGATGDPASVLDLVAACRPDVVLVDPRLPDVDSGLALIEALHEGCPDVLIVAMSCADSLEHPVLGRGADAFVAKGGHTEELIDAVIRAARSRPLGNRPRGDVPTHSGVALPATAAALLVPLLVWLGAAPRSTAEVADGTPARRAGDPADRVTVVSRGSTAWHA